MSFRTDMNREYSEKLMRNKSDADVIIFPTYLKKWDWTRIYDLKFDLTQSIRVDFAANAAAYVKEPPGAIDKSSPSYQTYKDSVWNEIKNFGHMNNYTQSLDVNYNLPINKIPFLSWMTASVRYGSDYRRTASPYSIQQRFGNTIENSNEKSINGSINMTTLYNKVKFLKKLNEDNSGRGGPTPKPTAAKQPDNKTKPGLTKQKQDTTKNGPNILKFVLDNTLRILTSLKNASVTYTHGEGTLLPGFMPTPQSLGNNWNMDAPGLPFVFGYQPSGPEYFRSWITQDTDLNSTYATKMNDVLNLRATLEPFRDFRIEITANRNYSESHQEYYTSNSNGDFKRSSPMTTGNFSISFLSWSTAFTADQSNNRNAIFERLKQNRLTIAERLAGDNPNTPGTRDSANFPVGYGGTSQSVLIPAFLAAYSGKDPSKYNLNPFPTIPMPNWRITWSGLTRIEWIKKYIRTINISHSYRSTYSVGSFTTNLLYEEQNGAASHQDDIRNFVSKRDIQQVSINEQFAPLIDFDITWVNSLLTKIEIKKSRTLSLSFTNNQVTDVSSNEFIVGLGYRFKDVAFMVKPVGGGKKTQIKSDLTPKADFSIKTNKTVLRAIDQDIEQVPQARRSIPSILRLSILSTRSSM
jgi:cell surface protein SprA